MGIWNWIIVVCWVFIIAELNQFKDLGAGGGHLKSGSTLLGRDSTELEVRSVEAAILLLNSSNKSSLEEILGETGGVFFGIDGEVHQICASGRWILQNWSLEVTLLEMYWLVDWAHGVPGMW